MLLETEPYSQLLTGVRQRLSGLFILQIFVFPKFLSEFGCILYYKIYVAWYNGILCNSWIRLTNLYVKISLFISWTLTVCAYSMCLIYLYLTLYPSTSKILLVILLTVCYTIFIILAWRIWYQINQSSSNWYFSLFLSLVCLMWYWYCYEKICFGH